MNLIFDWFDWSLEREHARLRADIKLNNILMEAIR